MNTPRITLHLAGLSSAFLVLLSVEARAAGIDVVSLELRKLSDAIKASDEAVARQRALALLTSNASLALKTEVIGLLAPEKAFAALRGLAEHLLLKGTGGRRELEDFVEISGSAFHIHRQK